MQPRRGCWVTTITVRDVSEIYALRRHLECVALRHVVDGQEQVGPLVAALRGRLDDMEQAQRCERHLDIGLADMALHRSIVEASGYSRVLEAWDRVGDETLLLMTQLSLADSTRHGPSGDHAGIVDAIEQRDSDLAVGLLERHLLRAEGVINESLRSAPPSPIGALTDASTNQPRG
nr:GntR family transcriptional regulator [Ilumatobacter fluminis]